MLAGGVGRCLPEEPGEIGPGVLVSERRGVWVGRTGVVPAVVAIPHPAPTPVALIRWAPRVETVLRSASAIG